MEEEQITKGIKESRHLKPCHKLIRERIKVILTKQYLQYDSDSKNFLCVNIEDSFPKISILKDNKNNSFSCSCTVYKAKLDQNAIIPGVAACEHEGALFVAFKIGYFKQSRDVWSNFQWQDPSTQEDLFAFNPLTPSLPVEKIPLPD